MDLNPTQVNAESQPVKGKVYCPKMVEELSDDNSNLLKEKAIHIINSFNGLTPNQIKEVLRIVDYSLNIIPVKFEYD